MTDNKHVLNLVSMSPELTKRLNEIAEKEKRAYTELIDVYSLRYGNSRFWWATPLASRDTLMERAFLSFCIVKLVFELLKSETFDEIVVPLYSIKQCLEDNLTGIEIIWPGDEKLVERKWRKSKRVSLRNLCTVVRFNKKRGKKRFNTRGLKGKQIFLVDTDVTIGEVSGSDYKDRYFGGFTENTDENIIYFYTPCYENRVDGEKIIEVINGKNDRIMYESLFRWIDILDILKYRLFCSRISFQGAIVDGIDMRRILEGEIKYGQNGINCFYGLLKSKAILRFIKKSGANIKGIIGWYEGQPSSNAFFFELRRKTDIPTMAYVLSPMYDYNIGCSPSRVQEAMKSTPEYFGIQGDVWREQVKAFCENVKVIKVPSFRFQKVFENVLEEKTGKDIMLVLSYNQKASRELILAIDALDMQVSKIKLKNHPANATILLEDYEIDEKKLNYKYEFVSGNMKEALNGVNIAIVAETTSALEILISGVKVIVWNRPGVLRNSCTPDKILKKRFIINAFTPNEIQESVAELKNLKLSKTVLDEIREETFTTVSRETVKLFLEEWIKTKEVCK